MLRPSHHCFASAKQRQIHSSSSEWTFLNFPVFGQDRPSILRRTSQSFLGPLLEQLILKFPQTLPLPFGCWNVIGLFPDAEFQFKYTRIRLTRSDIAPTPSAPAPFRTWGTSELTVASCVNSCLNACPGGEMVAYDRNSINGSVERNLGRSSLTYEELLTFLCQVEGVVHSRLLTFLSSDPEDVQPLTPSDILLGRRAAALPTNENTEELTPTTGDLHRRGQHRQTVTAKLWRRWNREYLLLLRSAYKSTHDPLPSLKPRVVSIRDKYKVPKMLRKLARVLVIAPGRDTVPRAFKRRAANGQISPVHFSGSVCSKQTGTYRWRRERILRPKVGKKRKLGFYSKRGTGTRDHYVIKNDRRRQR